MKIVIAPDSYKESLSAKRVAQAIAAGFAEIFPDAHYVCLPVADGGEGTVEALVDASAGYIRPVRVRGPLGQPVEAFYGMMGNGETAVIEMASASGLALLSPGDRNPMRTSSFGTGELILAALNAGAKRLILGIGGSATNDGGLGMLQALGAQFLDAQGSSIGEGGGALGRLSRIDLSTLDVRLEHITLQVACDVTNPLCGPNGASAIFGPQKGATPEQVAQLDANLRHYAHIVRRDFAREIEILPGSGAAGGLGAAALGFLNGQLQPGVDIVMNAVQMDTHLADADWVITGEGRIDRQTIQGKTPMGVARRAKRFNLPVIAIAGCVSDDVAEVYAHGIDAVFSAVPRAQSLEDALEKAEDNVRRVARNVAALLALRT